MLFLFIVTAGFIAIDADAPSQNTASTELNTTPPAMTRILAPSSGSSA